MDKPQKATIRVALDHLHQCPTEVTDCSRGSVNDLVAQAPDDPTFPMGDVASYPNSIEAATWASLLRPRQRSDGDTRDKSGEM